MADASTRRGGLAAGILLFAVGIFGALITGTTALVLWLASRIGSISQAAFVVCMLFVLLAIISYRLSIRDTVERLRAKLDTIAEVAGIFKRGYVWVLRQGLHLAELFVQPLASRK